MSQAEGAGPDKETLMEHGQPTSCQEDAGLRAQRWQRLRDVPVALIPTLPVHELLDDVYAWAYQKHAQDLRFDLALSGSPAVWCDDAPATSARWYYALADAHEADWTSDRDNVPEFDPAYQPCYSAYWDAMIRDTGTRNRALDICRPDF